LNGVGPAIHQRQRAGSDRRSRARGAAARRPRATA